ncbi:MAG: lamin tail domain-containing protein [Calditrichaceae bacterium]|nr:lamin tail domain-containing protein [Calditrichaceae bacterium]
MQKLSTIIILLILTTFSYSQIFISEYSDATGTGNYIYEFVELYNNSASPQDIEGYTLWQASSTQSFTFPAATIIPAYGILVLGRNADQSAFETFWGVSFGANSIYVNSGNSAPQLNGEEVYLFEDPLGINVDPATDDEYSSQAISSGNRVYRVSTGNTLSDWVMNPESNATPGSLEGDQALPVELTSFTANAGNNSVTLNWTTASESENLGYSIMRGMAKDGNYEEIDSYVNNKSLKGAGNSSTSLSYKFVDNSVMNEITYWYKLVDVDFNGVRTEHGPIYATPRADEVEANPVDGNIPLAFGLAQNFPNPFNPSTTISFDIPKLNDGIMNAKLVVYDMLGQKVKTLLSSTVEAGHFEMNWDGRNDLNQVVPSGIYIYQFQSELFNASKKMVLMR